MTLVENYTNGMPMLESNSILIKNMENFLRKHLCISIQNSLKCFMKVFIFVFEKDYLLSHCRFSYLYGDVAIT